MGSFLLNCGVTNRVLTEGENIQLVFLTMQVLDREGNLESSNSSQTWYPESILLSAKQSDYGHVEVEDEGNNRAVMEKIMLALAQQDAQTPSTNSSHPTWGQFFKQEIVSKEVLVEQSFDKISEYFNKMLTIMHSQGIFYKSNVQGTTSLMRVAHVDAVVFETLLQTPAIYDNAYLNYNTKKDYSRSVFENFEDYLDYMIVITKCDVDKMLSDKYYMYRPEVENYHALFGIANLEKCYSNNEAIQAIIYNQRTHLLLSYARLVGMQFKPSIYASQDYQENVSKNYRTFMSKVFEKQRNALKENTLSNNYENSEDSLGDAIPQDMSFEEYKAQESLVLGDHREIIVTKKNTIIHETLDDWEYLQSVRKSSEK